MQGLKALFWVFSYVLPVATLFFCVPELQANQGHGSGRDIVIENEKKDENLIEGNAEIERKLREQARNASINFKLAAEDEGLDEATRKGYIDLSTSVDQFSENFSKMPAAEKEVFFSLAQSDKLVLSTQQKNQDSEVFDVEGVKKSQSWFGGDSVTNAGQIELSNSEKNILGSSATWSASDAQAVTLSMLGRSFDTRRNSNAQNPGIQKAPDADSAYQRTLDGVASSGSTSSGSGVSVADQATAGRFQDMAKNILGVPSRGSFDLGGNPLYKSATGTPIQSALKNMAFEGLSGTGQGAGASGLKDLLTTPGFQNMSNISLGPEATKDLNLLTAGAEILNNPDLPALGKEISQDYIGQNLSSAKMIQDNQALNSLSQSVGLGSLGQLTPETLRWISVSGDLAYEDLEKIPEKYRPQRELYRKGFEDLRQWLKSLREYGVLGEVDSIKVPMSPDLAREGWQENSKKFVQTHFDTANSFHKIKDQTDETKLMEKMLRRVGLWWQKVPEYDVEKIQQWGTASHKKTEFSKQWMDHDSVSLRNARYYNARLYYYGTLPQFFSGSQAPLAILVRDSQEWSRQLKLQEKRRARQKMAHQRSQKK